MDFLHLFGRTREARRRLESQRSRLYRIAYAWTHNAALADDLVQETLAKAFAKSGQLRDPKAGDAWLFSILANCYNDHFRRHRESQDLEDVELAHESTPEKESGAQEIVRKVRAAIDRLPHTQRQVVTLVDIEGFSYMDVARILNVPIGTVMSRVCRARAALKETLCRDLSSELVDEDVKAKIWRVK